VPGTFLGLEIGRRGIQNQQKALDVTGHNLANASTEGYSRQVAVFETTDPYSSVDINSSATPGQLGTGVNTAMVSRIRDQYMDPQVRNVTKAAYYWESQTSIYNRVEVCFSEPDSSGIEDQIVEFFKSWQNLNNNPQDPGVKATVAEVGDQLASLMTYTYSQLSDIDRGIMTASEVPDVESGQLKDSVDRVNVIIQQVNSLTADIKKIFQVGQQPNDLMDKRDLLLDELARYGPLSVVNESLDGKPTGGITYTFFGLDIDNTTNFKLNINDQEGEETFGNLELQTGSGTLVVDLSAMSCDGITGGSLLGLEKVRQDILGYKAMLNDIAVNMRDKICEKNADTPPADVLDFFSGSLAEGNFEVNQAVTSNPDVIVGTKAQYIAAIRNEDIDGDRTYSLEEYYALLVTEVGNNAKSADDMAANQGAILEQMANLRESVSGVSVDEELTKMVQFQYGYQASARVITMWDEILGDIINRIKPL